MSARRARLNCTNTHQECAGCAHLRPTLRVGANPLVDNDPADLLTLSSGQTVPKCRAFSPSKTCACAPDAAPFGDASATRRVEILFCRSMTTFARIINKLCTCLAASYTWRANANACKASQPSPPVVRHSALHRHMHVDADVVVSSGTPHRSTTACPPSAPRAVPRTRTGYRRPMHVFPTPLFRRERSCFLQALHRAHRDDTGTQARGRHRSFPQDFRNSSVRDGNNGRVGARSRARAVTSGRRATRALSARGGLQRCERRLRVRERGLVFLVLELEAREVFGALVEARAMLVHQRRERDGRARIDGLRQVR